MRSALGRAVKLGLQLLQITINSPSLASMEISNILIWNVCGLNKKAHRAAVRQIIMDARPEIICLQKTKVQNLTQRMLLTTLGADFDGHATLPADRTRGGVLIAWKSEVCQAITLRIDAYTVSVLFNTPNGQQWWFTGVYGPQRDAHKLLFLSELRSVRAACQGAWIVVGDFNLIYRARTRTIPTSIGP